MRILVIEDDKELALSLKKGLELSSYAVDTVSDGEQGEAYALSGDYDLAIIDWMLPIKSGVDVCKSVRVDGATVPIILLTAKNTTNEKIQGLDAGADDYLTKPFAFGELLARVRALLRRPEATLTPTLTIGDVAFDTSTRRTTRNGQEITLSVRESAILELFLRRPNHVFTKEQIVAHVWNDDADVLASTVESHVANLRAKLDKPFSGAPVIVTVWGKGYTVRYETAA